MKHIPGTKFKLKRNIGHPAFSIGKNYTLSNILKKDSKILYVFINLTDSIGIHINFNNTKEADIFLDRLLASS